MIAVDRNNLSSLNCRNLKNDRNANTISQMCMFSLITSLTLIHSKDKLETVCTDISCRTSFETF